LAESLEIPLGLPRLRHVKHACDEDKNMLHSLRRRLCTRASFYPGSPR